MNINALVPAMAIHPGEMLLDELKSKKITQKDFAIQIGYQHSQLNEIIKGKRKITADLALLIEKSLEIDAEYWLNLQIQYDLNISKINEKNKSTINAIGIWNMIKNYIPNSFFKKENIITGDPIIDIPSIKKIYALSNIEELPSVVLEPSFEINYRKSENLIVDQINLSGWTHLVRYKASQINVEKFDSQLIEPLINELKQVFLKNNKTIKESEKVLFKYGIKFIHLTHPEHCAVDGISFWSKGNPAVGLTVRNKRIDNFAFTLMHELGHIFLHLTSDNEAQFIDLDNQESNIKEEEANTFAGDHLINQNDWEDFLQNVERPFESDLIYFAKKHGLHPAIVLGRYSHQSKNYKLKSSIEKVLN